MKKLFSMILVSGLLLSGNAFALPKCEGKDDSKWTNCEGTYLNKEVGPGWTRDSTGEYGSVPGKKHGKGSTKLYKDGNFFAEYDGEYKDGKPNGQGTETKANGEKYVGEFRNGKRYGHGTLTYADGSTYVGEFKDDIYRQRLSHGYKKLDYNFKCLPGMQIFESNPNWEKSTNFGFLIVDSPFITSDKKYVILHTTWDKTNNEYNFPNSVVTETSLKDPKLSKLFEWYEQVGRGPVSATEESSTIWKNILFKSKKKPYKYTLQTKIVKIPDEDYKTINDGIDEILNDWMNENPSKLNEDAFVESLWFIGKLQSGFYKRYSNDMVAKVNLPCKSF